jgi:hypothetical protein
MPNTSGNAYALTALCPIRDYTPSGESGVLYTRTALQNLPTGATAGQKGLVSPMAKVPNTYLARFFILDDTIFQNFPHTIDHLKSSYLVFETNFYGDLDLYLKGMYTHFKEEIFTIWKYAYGFEDVVNNAHADEKNNGAAVLQGEAAFIKYIKKCQLNTTFFFNGSTDDSLAEQLKSLFLKQEFSKFVFEHQGVKKKDLKTDFIKFVQRTQPAALGGPTWQPGAHLEKVI